MTRILVVDDSLFIRKAITRIVAARPEMQVVAAAQSGEEALERMASSRPHVVTLDVDMPGMGGLATLREIQRRYPGLPVIMLSMHTRAGAETTLDAMGAGAVDFVDKSRLNVMDFDRLSHELLDKIEGWKQAPHAYSWDSEPTPRPSAAARVAIPRINWSAYDLCVIGASTGGPPALQQIVTTIPLDFSVPVVVVQHMPVGFTRPFAERLDALGGVRVKEATDHQVLRPGQVLLARAGAHLTIEPNLTAHLSLEPVHAIHTPSVDVMMTSASRARPGRVVGILLTGMGEDGAQGMLTIHQAGGLTLAESEASCVIYGMPRAAHTRGAVTHLLPLPEICALFAARSHDP